MFFFHYILQGEIEAHTRPGSLSVFVHYGQSRPKEAKLLAQYDVVLTTYGTLSSEFSDEVVLMLMATTFLLIFFCKFVLLI